MKITTLSIEKKNKIIAYWFIFGAFCIIIQVLIGGITRITESGLSITQWNPISGAMPPLNNLDWNILFEQYKQTDQYKFIKTDINLSDFKTLFFWEWFHRNWARLIGVFFIVPFIYFLIKKYLSKQQIYQCLYLIFIGLIQGLMGWIMVKSGLKKGNIYVEHTFLTIHFILALITLALCINFALKILIPSKFIIYNKPLFNFIKAFFIIIIIQLIYGAFMAGLHAAHYASTWPTINGEWIPSNLFQFCPPIFNLLYNKITIHFIHRGLAYIIFILAIIFLIKTSKNIFKNILWLRICLITFVLLQIILGIFTLLNSNNYLLMRWFAICHQFVGMMIFIEFVILYYIVKDKN